MVPTRTPQPLASSTSCHHRKRCQPRALFLVPWRLGPTRAWRSEALLAAWARSQAHRRFSTRAPCVRRLRHRARASASRPEIPHLAGHLSRMARPSCGPLLVHRRQQHPHPELLCCAPRATPPLLATPLPHSHRRTVRYRHRLPRSRQQAGLAITSACSRTRTRQLHQLRTFMTRLHQRLLHQACRLAGHVQ